MASKNLIFLLVIYAMGVGEIFGQNPQKSYIKFSQQNTPQSNFNQKSSNNNTKENKSVKLADKIISTLVLNDFEAKIIHELCEERANKIEKIKLNSDTSQQKINDLQTVNQVFDQKIKNLVSSAQFIKYENLRKAGH